MKRRHAALAALGILGAATFAGVLWRSQPPAQPALPPTAGDGEKAGLRYWLSLRADKYGRTDFGPLVAAWNAEQPLRAQPEADVWKYAGPKNLDIPSRNYYGTKPISGRVNAIAVEPGANPKIYLGGAFSGVWRASENTQWAPLNDQLFPTLMVGAIANKGGKLYVGTGDAHNAQTIGPFFIPGNTYGTSGVFIHDKAANTWQQTGVDEFGTLVNGAGATTRHGAHVNSLVALQEADGMLVAACFGDALASGKNPNGIWRYDGTAWKRAKDTEEENFFDLAIGALSPATGRRYYYATSLDSSELRRSNDDGKTWEKLATPAAAGRTHAYLVEASPVEPSTVYLMSFVDKKIWRSKEAGKTVGGWTNITGDIGVEAWNQHYYNWLLAVGSVRAGDGTDKDVVIAGGVQVFVLEKPDTNEWKEFSGDDTAASKIHRDFQAATFSPAQKNVAYIGSDGGIYRVTFDNAFQPTVENYMTREPDPKLGLTQFYQVAVGGADHGTILGGAQDNCTPFATAAAMGANKNWSNPCSLGDGGWVDISRIDPKRQVAAGYALSGQSMNFFYTKDNWTEDPRLSQPCPRNGEQSVIFPPVIFDSWSAGIVYTAFERLRYFRMSTGAWATVPGAVKMGQVVCLATSPTNDRVPSYTVYSGAFGGGVYMTRFKVGDFPNLDGPQVRIDAGNPAIVNPTGLPVTSIAVDPLNHKRIIVALGGQNRDERVKRIFVCDDVTKADAARKWIDATGDLPNIPVTAVKFWPKSGKEWWVANDLGVYVTTNNGGAYTNVTKNLPSTVANDLEVTLNSNIVTVATFGRGVWQARRADLLAAGP